MGVLGHLRGWEESPHDQVGRGREGGREEKWRQEWGLGRGEVPTLRGAHLRCRDLWGWGETFRELGYQRAAQPVSPPPAQALASLLGSWV